MRMRPSKTKSKPLFLICFCCVWALAVLSASAFGHGNHNNASANAGNAASANATDANVTNMHKTGRADEEKKAEQVARVGSQSEEFVTMHPLVVHFPIVLLILAAAFQIASLLVFRWEFGIAAFVLAVLGTTGAYLASNVFHPHTTDLNQAAADLLSRHEYYADLALWFGAAAAATKLICLRMSRWKRWPETAATILFLLASTAVSIAGHHGAELVHKEGVGPQGRFLERH